MKNTNLPHSIPAEEALIYGLINLPDAIHMVSEIVNPDDFYEPKLQRVAFAIWEMTRSGRPISYVSLSDELRKDPSNAGIILAAIGTNAVAMPHHMVSWAKIIRDKADRRKLFAVYDQATREILDESTDIMAVMAQTQQLDLLRDNQASDGKSIISELIGVQELYAEKYKQNIKYLGQPTGFEKIDDAIDGLRPGHIWVIGAWTSTGKTQFTLNIVHRLLNDEVPVSIISLEMSRVDTVARIIGIRHNLSAGLIIKGRTLSLAERQNVLEGQMLIERSKLFVQTTYFDVEKIKLAIRRDVAKHGVKVVVVDYVQNITTEEKLTEYQLLTKVAVDLQALSRELQIAIMLVSQISNESQKGNGAGAGFKGTGALEAVADLAIRLERDKKKEGPDDEYVPVAIKIVKNRHGFTGVIDNYCMYLKSGKFVGGLPHIPYDIRLKISAQKPLVSA